MDHVPKAREAAAMMDDLLTVATESHKQAECWWALAAKEGDKTKQRIMFALAEQYYLPHDQLVELDQFALGPKFTCDDRNVLRFPL